MSDAAIRRLSHDQRGRLMDVKSCTWGSQTPGVMTEEDVRAWAGYSPVEWRQHRAVFEPLFNTTKRAGQWLMVEVMQELEAAQNAFEAAREKALKGVEARRSKSSGDSALPTTGSPQVALGLEPGVQPQIDPRVNRGSDIPEVQRTEFERTAVPDSRGQRPALTAPAVAGAGVTAAAPSELLERALRAAPADGTGVATEDGA